MRGALRYWAMWLLVRVAGRLPTRALYLVADISGTAAWYGCARLRAVTRDHMRHALARGEAAPAPAEVDRAARGCVRTAARNYADFGRGAHLPRERAFAEVEQFEHIDRFFDASDRGCGVILVSAHFGSPEYLFRAAGYLGMNMLVLTEPLSPPRLHALVHAVRNAPGVRFLPADRSGLRETIAHLRRGGVLALLADRDIQGTGLPVPFFGERATLPTGPVELALRTNATVLPMFSLRTGIGRYRVCTFPPLALARTDDREADLAAGMRALARALEEGIRAAPEQWFALQPVWSGLPRSAGGPRTIDA